MKEEGTTHWSSPNGGATNESGFSGLPGGLVLTVGCSTILPARASGGVVRFRLVVSPGPATCATTIPVRTGSRWMRSMGVRFVT